MGRPDHGPPRKRCKATVSELDQSLAGRCRALHCVNRQVLARPTSELLDLLALHLRRRPDRLSQSIRPTSEVKREEIEELRRWAREHLAIDAVQGAASAGERLIEF